MDPVRAMERMLEAGHDSGCVRNQCLRGRPTESGGYEYFYRTDSGLAWYESRPTDRTPKCDCGVTEAAATLERLIPFVKAAMAFCKVQQPFVELNGAMGAREMDAAYRRLTGETR